jgi:hypothetical protein
MLVLNARWNEKRATQLTNKKCEICESFYP